MKNGHQVNKGDFVTKERRDDTEEVKIWGGLGPSFGA